jgi:hypothetical protein
MTDSFMFRRRVDTTRLPKEPVGVIHLRVCEVREPDGLPDPCGSAPHKKRGFAVVQREGLSIGPPHFWMESKFDRPCWVRAEMG